jgi:hypothetical protein
MKKTVLTFFAATVLAGSIGAAAAGERYHHARTYRTAPVVAEPYRAPSLWDRRDSYAWSYPDYDYWASRVAGGAISAPAGH